MAPFFLKILTKEYRTKETRAAIELLRSRVTTLRPILEDIGKMHVEEVHYRIKTQTSPKGRVWRHNTDDTQYYKRKGMQVYNTFRGPAIEGPNKRLVWTGDLRDNLYYKIVYGSTVVISSNVPYATTQQFGAKIGQLGKTIRNGTVLRSPWGEIPARPFLGMNKKTTNQTLKILSDYMLGNRIAKTLGFSS